MSAAAFSAYPTLPPAAVAEWGPTLVIIPHPDDESLGCGGAIALLRQAGYPVWCVLVTDGTMSHPNSLEFPAAARQAMREQELRQALQVLAVAEDALTTLGLPDGAVPAPDTPAGAAAVEQLQHLLQTHQPTSVLVPWRRDPHPDHRAAYQLVAAALRGVVPAATPRRLEYVVWAWERAAPTDLPQPGEVTGWHLDITPVVAQKQQAIAAHRSQLPGSPIKDDPTGFTLAPSMLSHFARPTEVYLEGC